MRIAIIGYGKMGKEVERLAIEKGHTITGIVRNEEDQWPVADVAIEFSSPEAALSNYRKAFDLKIPIVSGTTGWYEHIDEIRKEVVSSNSSFLYASNFSIGVNLFFQLNKQLAQLMDKHKDYICDLEEIHHTEKKDAPSGTAITLAEGILDNSASKNKWMSYTDVDDMNNDSELLPILSKREPNVPGTHIVTYQNNIDSIAIKHVVKNRAGFALGAIFAAEWMMGRVGFYNMANVLGTVE